MRRFLPVLAAVVLPLAAPAEAHACGGTFCDPGPAAGSMSVDQTGETILFAIDGGTVEAHIQIEYEGGDADRFAWIVPVPAVPEIEVGAWRLIDAALAATVPVYGFEFGDVCDAETGADPGSGGGFIEAPDGGGSSPTIVAQDVVGAFEYAVIDTPDGQALTDWLVDNEYAVEPDAPAILDTYVDEGHVFVAFKLRHGQGVDDIHPVVVRYPGIEPCIPMRLTRVAARQNMEIRALFLGQARVVPTNFRHVRLNRTRLNWLSQGINYRELVSMAVDAPAAGGRAFVTEYAGSSDVVSTDLLDTSALDASAFADAAVVDVVDILQTQGMAQCGNDNCDWLHELTSSLLHDFVPVPDGFNDGEFYSCLTCYAGVIDASAWDAEAFMAAYEERIVAPLRHANTLLETWPYLTRLYTTISPHEMTVDPMFAERADLADVAHRHGAELNDACCGDVMRVPGGRQIWLDGSSWPQWTDAMPWAERVEEFGVGDGPAAELANHSGRINQLVAQWNAAAACDAERETEGSPVPRPDDDDRGSSSSGSTGPGAAADDGTAKPGCACRWTPTRTPSGMTWAGLGLLALLRTRRHQ